jgi:hypothetical protein
MRDLSSRRVQAGIRPTIIHAGRCDRLGTPVGEKRSASSSGIRPAEDEPHLGRWEAIDHDALHDEEASDDVTWQTKTT